MRAADEKEAVGPNMERLVGHAALAGICVVGLSLFFYWGSLVRWTADQHDDEAMLWIYATDVAPGDTIEGRVEIESGLKLAIQRVVVSGAGEDQVVAGHPPAWGDRIETRLGAGKASDELTFEVKVPRDTAPGVLRLELAIEYVTAEGMVIQFTNEEHVKTFFVEVKVHGRAMSVARRAGKTALAIGSWLLVVVGTVLVSRWYARQRRSPGLAWLLVLAPVAVVGGWWFATLLGHALRLHGWWFVVPGVVVWLLAFAVAARVARSDAMRRFVVRQTVIPTDADGAYRSSGAPVPSRTVDELDAAWQGAGLAVVRRRGELEVCKIGVGTAFVPLPASGMFGGGEELVIRSEGDAIVGEMVTAAEQVLGPLSWQE